MRYRRLSRTIVSLFLRSKRGYHSLCSLDDAPTRLHARTRARQKKVRLFVKMCRTLCSEDEQHATTMPSSSSSSSQWWRGHTTVCPSVCLSVWRGESGQWAGAARACVALHTSHSTKAHSKRPTAETWTWRPVAALSSSSYSRPRWQPCLPPTSSSTRPSSRRDVIWRARVETCWPCTTRARSTTAPSSTPGQLFIALSQVKV